MSSLTATPPPTARDLSFSYSFGGPSAAEPRVKGRVECWYDEATDPRTIREVLMERTNVFVSQMCALFDSREAITDEEDPHRVEDMAGAIAEAVTALHKEPSGKCVPVADRAKRLLAVLEGTPYSALREFVAQRVRVMDLMVAAYKDADADSDMVSDSDTDAAADSDLDDLVPPVLGGPRPHALDGHDDIAL